MPTNNVAKRVRFFFVDGFIAAPLLLLMVYPRMSTLIFLLVTCVVLFILERRGVPLPMLLRKFRTFFIGRERYIRPWWRKL